MSEPDRNTLSLADARERTPAPAGIGSFAEKLRLAAFNSISESDVQAIVAKQVEKAKAGDTAATKYVMDFATGGGAPKVEKVVEKIIERVVVKKGKRGRVVAARPAPDDAPPVAALVVPSLSVKQLRRMAALHLLHHSKATGSELARLLDVPPDQLDTILECDWFSRQNQEWRLASAGRREVG